MYYDEVKHHLPHCHVGGKGINVVFSVSRDLMGVYYQVNWKR